MPFRIETDMQLRRALGTDGPAWASAYLAQRQHLDGDMLHIELTAWFDAAIKAGIRAECSSWNALIAADVGDRRAGPDIVKRVADAIREKFLVTAHDGRVYWEGVARAAIAELAEASR